MNITRLHILSVILLLMVSVACSRHSAVSDTLAHAEAIMEEHPDSALAILEAIPDSTLTSRADRALHALLLSQALDKNYIDITSDSLINIAVDYYQDYGDRHEMLANYYYAKVASNAEEYSKSTFAILKAKELSEKMKDTLFIARSNEVLGDLYFRNFDFENEIKQRKIVIKHYHDINRTLNEIYANIDLSLAYTQNGHPAKAIEVLKGIDSLIDKSKTPLYKAYLEAYIHPYILIKEYESAQNITNQLIEMFGENEYSYITYSKISEAYLKSDDIGKARYFLNKSIDKYPDSKSSINVLLRFLEIYKYMNDIPRIINMIDSVQWAQNTYARTIVNQQISNAERDYYNIIAFESDKRQSLTKRNLIIVSLAATIIIVVTVVIFRLKMRLRKEEIENKAKDIILLSDELRSLKMRSEKWDAIISKVYSERFDRLLVAASEFLDNRESVASMKAYSHNMEKELDHLYDSKFLKSAEKEIDSARDNIVARLRESGIFNDEEIGLFVLLLLNLSPRSIAIITKNNIKTVYSRKRRIREKLLSSGIERKDEYITFLS